MAQLLITAVACAWLVGVSGHVEAGNIAERNAYRALLANKEQRVEMQVRACNEKDCRTFTITGRQAWELLGVRTSGAIIQSTTWVTAIGRPSTIIRRELKDPISGHPVIRQRYHPENDTVLTTKLYSHGILTRRINHRPYVLPKSTPATRHPSLTDAAIQRQIERLRRPPPEGRHMSFSECIVWGEAAAEELLRKKNAEWRLREYRCHVGAGSILDPPA